MALHRSREIANSLLCRKKNESNRKKGSKRGRFVGIKKKGIREDLKGKKVQAEKVGSKETTETTGSCARKTRAADQK